MNTENIEKVYNTREEKIIALSNFTYKFDKNKFYAIMGHSGSGKSTLIRILGLMDDTSSGKYYINNVDTNGLNDLDLSKLRMNNIGFVFQNYHLDANLKAFENVMLPMVINKNIDKKKRMERVDYLLDLVGLKNRSKHYPKELSGGEQQRICIARALANDPDFLLCDEPTGNLDEENEHKILTLLKKLSKEGKCVIVVSHSKEILEFADEVLLLKNGKLVKENENK